MKLRYFIIFSIALVILSVVVQANAQDGTITTLNPWKLTGSIITPRNASNSLQVPSLGTTTANICLSANASGTFTLVTCGTGGGGSGATTTINGVNGPTFTFTTSTASGLWSISNPSGSTIRFTLPSNVAFFTNDAGYLTAALTSLNGSTSSTQTFATSTGTNAWTITTANGVHTFKIPSNVGFFTNDAGYLTAALTSLDGSVSSSQTFTRTNDTNVTLTLTTTTDGVHNFALGWSGQLGVTRGGTATSTFNNGLVIASGTNAFTSLTTNGNGSIPIASGTSWTANTLTQGSNMVITNAAGSITLAVTSTPTFTTVSSTNATFGAATTTSFAITSIASGNCLHTGAGGLVSGTGSDCGAGGGGAESGWRETSGYVYLVTSTDQVGIGATSSASKLFIAGLPQISATGTVLFLTPNAANSWTTINAGHASGTVIGINTTSTFNGDLMNLQVGSSTKFQLDSTGRVYATTGTLALPSYTFLGDTNTGMMSEGADQLTLTTNGQRYLYLSSGQIRIDRTGAGVLFSNTSFNGFTLGDVNTITSPTLSWANNPDTGIFRPGSNTGADAANIGFSLKGVERARFVNFTSPTATTSLLLLSPSSTATGIVGGHASGTLIGTNPSVFNGDFMRFQVNSSTQFSISGTGHVNSSGTVPTVGNCGGSPTITGTDTAGKVVTGSNASSTCTVTFNKAYTATPVCTVTSQTTSSIDYIAVPSATTLQIKTSTSSAFNANTLSYICIGFD